MDMDELRIAICEDIEADQKSILQLVQDSGIRVRCETYKSGEEFLERFTSGMYHLIYLDIYMGKLTGMETASVIRERDRAVLLAFTTNSRDYAFEANQYRSLLYIEKPVTQEMVNHTLTVASALWEKEKNKILTVSTAKKRVGVRHDDLIYAEVRNQRCILHLRQGRHMEVSTNVNIDDLERMLPQPRFCRTHRAYIVNLDFVDHTNGSDFVMEEGGVAYIKQKEYRRIMKQYYSWLFEKAREDKL